MQSYKYKPDCKVSLLTSVTRHTHYFQVTIAQTLPPPTYRQWTALCYKMLAPRWLFSKRDRYYIFNQQNHKGKNGKAKLDFSQNMTSCSEAQTWFVFQTWCIEVLIFKIPTGPWGWANTLCRSPPNRCMPELGFQQPLSTKPHKPFTAAWSYLIAANILTSSDRKLLTIDISIESNILEREKHDSCALS